jgi:homoserine kinase
LTSLDGIRAKAYCSSANLGAGFDVFGLALDRYKDTVTVRWAGKGGVILHVEGEYSNGIPSGLSDNAAGPPIIEMIREGGVVGRGVEITIDKGVPPGLGLGSSGATAAACVKALDAFLHLHLTDDELVRFASLGEAIVSGNPHADNVAASILGGFTIVYDKSPVRTVSIRPPSNLSVIVATPKLNLPSKKTRAARKLLPKIVPITSSVLNTGRASAMVAGFANGDIELIGHGMEDELAEPYREKMIPGYRSVKKAALAAKASGVAISGAGPSIIAIVNKRKQEPEKIGLAIVKAFSTEHVQSSFFVTRPAEGAEIIRG